MTPTERYSVGLMTLAASTNHEYRARLLARLAWRVGRFVVDSQIERALPDQHDRSDHG